MVRGSSWPAPEITRRVLSPVLRERVGGIFEFSLAIDVVYLGMIYSALVYFTLQSKDHTPNIEQGCSVYNSNLRGTKFFSFFQYFKR